MSEKKRPLLTTDQVATIFGVTRGCIERARSARRGLGLIPLLSESQVQGWSDMTQMLWRHTSSKRVCSDEGR